MTSTVSFKEWSERDAIAEAKKHPNNLFEDKDFPASPSSLFINASKPSHPPSQVAAWKRPQEIAPGAELFIDGASSGDVCQGALGDCWFIGALAVVAARWDLLKELIVSSHPELGFYQFRFWKADRWINVTIDDRIPCTAANKPIYAHCENPKEMWVALFEKAYAKLHGSYEALSGGSIAYAFVDLTGGAAEKVNFQTLVSQGKLWSSLQYFLQEAWLMGSALSQDGATEGDNGKGILLKHAYSLLDAKEVEGTKLIHLRNPWGSTDWRGAWSDSDSRWTPELLKKLNHKLDGDDGDFWMSLQDYQTNFNRLYICRLYNDSIGAVWERNQLALEWKGKTAGGCMNHPTWIFNQQFALRPKTNTPVFISLMQNDTRLNGLPSSDIGVYLLETDDSSKPKTVPSGIIANSGPFSDDREAVLSAELLGGHQYVGFGATFQPGFEGKHIITVYTKEPCDVYILTDQGAILDKVDPFSVSGGGGSNTLKPGNPFYQEKKDKSNRASKPPKNYRNKAAINTTPTPTTPTTTTTPSRTPTTTPSRTTTPTTTPSTTPARATTTTPTTPVVAKTSVTTTTTVTIQEPARKNVVVKRPENVSDPSTVQTVKLSNGDVYTGQINSSQKHGVGTYRYHTGDVYTGTFVNDEQEGEGEYVFASGDKYVGEMKNSKFAGWGVYHYRNGDRYEGEFKSGVRHGVGTFIYADGTVFKGHYNNGIKEGYGVSRFADGNRYEGEFKAGKPNGSGAYYFSNGSVYRGKFADDHFEDSDAVYEASNGDLFTGSYKKGERNGKGTLKSAKGFTYKGDWKSNKMDGYGEYTFSSGERYVGELKNNEFHGKGTYYYNDGKTVSGEFRNGKPVGN